MEAWCGFKGWVFGPDGGMPLRFAPEMYSQELRFGWCCRVLPFRGGRLAAEMGFSRRGCVVRPVLATSSRLFVRVVAVGCFGGLSGYGFFGSAEDQKELDFLG
jgi:peptidoglycan/LPS O-acetylase OafA/YrhL